MKIPIPKLLTIISLPFVVAMPGKADESNSARGEYELAYQQWHAELANTDYSGGFFFDTEYGPPRLVAAVKKIKDYGLRMAGYICEKVANEPDVITRTVYSDVKLLDAITGITYYQDPPTGDNVAADMAVFKARFREEWRAGLYEHPDEKLAELLEPLLKQEPISKINPKQLANITRFGIYGVPELIRQIKKNNSATAFCVYLRVTGQRDYSAYLKKCDQMFVTKDEKLKHIEDKVKEWKAKGDDKERVVMKIDAALKE